MDVMVTGGSMTPNEQQLYIDYIEGKYNRKVSSLNIELDGDEVNLKYTLQEVPFERIRRITGYLVGTMDHWNNAKASEEHDRVKHTIQ